MDDINIQIIDMDVMIPEQISRNADGSYTIFLNARLTQERRFQSYQYALQHISAGDFECEDGNVQEIEMRTHAVLHTDRESPCNLLSKESEASETKYTKALARIRRKKKALKKQLKEYEKDMILMNHQDPSGAFARAEHQWLYGSDL